MARLRCYYRRMPWLNCEPGDRVDQWSRQRSMGGGPAALTVPGIGGGVIVGWLSGVVVEHRRGKQSRVRDADSREATLLPAKDAERPSTSEKDQGLTNS